MKVIINIAMTLDGKIDNIARKGAKISSDSDWERVDRLRAEQDAILIGGKTLLGEDPRLTVKSAALRDERVARGFEPDPVKVGIVSNATLSAKSRFLTAGRGKIIIFTTEQSSGEALAFLRDAGVVVCVLGKKRVDLSAALAFLEEHGVEKIMIEGGGGINAAFLTAGLVDEIHVYIAPLIFGGATAPTLADGKGVLDGEKLKLMELEKFDDGGILAKYQVLG
ncbi:MAG: 2,5-diamino-6-(ribosylamino)-4(3H)-pyrimidinone 5'-phosphate reductase [Chloroflexi bacterium]|nr:2,5-diamino-6-(ribosylamino)-4(3H)-pyrimidinone 5'-phosphate reductase [Chloroflexota bacterium]